jgi:predicted GIY-YIG superfamily endonuclease
MSESEFFVYVLRRKDNNKVFYVGETNCPERRLRQHLEGTAISTEAIVEWAKRTSVGIEMQIVGRFGTRQGARGYEHELIYRARDKGYWLANHDVVPTASLRRSGKRWTEKELQQLVHMYEIEHCSPLEIAKSLGRGYGSVMQQLKRQGIVIQW